MNILLCHIKTIMDLANIFSFGHIWMDLRMTGRSLDFLYQLVALYQQPHIICWITVNDFDLNIRSQYLSISLHGISVAISLGNALSINPRRRHLNIYFTRSLFYLLLTCVLPFLLVHACFLLFIQARTKPQGQEEASKKSKES